MSENIIIPVPAPEPSPRATLTIEQRQDILNNEIANWVRRGWVVQSLNGAQVVLYKEKRIGWFWNLILTLITGGLWAIVWIIRIINRKTYQVVINVDEYGNLTRPV